MVKTFAKVALSAAVASLSVTAFGQALEEVVVTAQKRTESLQDVPISVTAISGELIQDASIRSFEELEYQVSSAGGLAGGKVRTAADLLETDWAESADPTYTSLVGEHEIRLPKGPWLFDGKDTGALSTAALRGANNREVLSEGSV